MKAVYADTIADQMNSLIAKAHHDERIIREFVMSTAEFYDLKNLQGTYGVHVNGQTYRAIPIRLVDVA